MKFNRYSSIDNSYRLKTIALIQEQLPKGQFVVQEKIHGSNFAIYTDGETVRYAKRGGLLNGEETFFNHARLERYELERKIKTVFEYMKSEFGDEIEQVSIHGEIFGGSYPHDDVEKVNGVSRVQKEVLYAPDTEFMAFDIKVNDTFIDMDNFITLCEELDIPHLPILLTGTLAEALEYNNEYQTTVPKMLGLPEIPDNICEGNVIKPVKTAYFGNGSRIVVKNKNAKFSEKSGQKGTPTPKDPLPKHILDMMARGNEYVCENRLRNVLSHIGEVKQNEFGKILGLMGKDVIEDFIKDVPEFLELEKKERKEVQRFLNGKVGFLIRPNFANIIDGTY
jgi:Rnl2 family RNA ligase